MMTVILIADVRNLGRKHRKFDFHPFLHKAQGIYDALQRIHPSVIRFDRCRHFLPDILFHVIANRLHLLGSEKSHAGTRCKSECAKQGTKNQTFHKTL